MPSGLLQSAFGDILNTLSSDNPTPNELALVIQRIVQLLSSPLVLSEPLSIAWNGTDGPAIDVTAATNAAPQAISVSQNGQQATLGVGMESSGVVASALANDDLYQPSPALAARKLTLAATGAPDPGTCLGYGSGSFGSGNPARDNGTASAAPGETMPAATISGYSRVVNGNLWTEGLLLTKLTAPANGQTGATTAQLQTWIPDPTQPANWSALPSPVPPGRKNGPVIVVVNRDTRLSVSANKYLQCAWCGDCWQPNWASC